MEALEKAMKKKWRVVARSAPTPSASAASNVLPEPLCGFTVGERASTEAALPPVQQQRFGGGGGEGGLSWRVKGGGGRTGSTGRANDVDLLVAVFSRSTSVPS